MTRTMTSTQLRATLEALDQLENYLDINDKLLDSSSVEGFREPIGRCIVRKFTTITNHAIEGTESEQLDVLKRFTIAFSRAQWVEWEVDGLTDAIGKRANALDELWKNEQKSERQDMQQRLSQLQDDFARCLEKHASTVKEVTRLTSSLSHTSD